MNVEGWQIKNDNLLHDKMNSWPPATTEEPERVRSIRYKHKTTHAPAFLSVLFNADYHVADVYFSQRAEKMIAFSSSWAR